MKKIRAEILRLLQKNARISDQEIADRLAVDVETVQTVIRQLEKEHVIMGYSALINPDQLETPEVRAVIEVEVLPERDGGFDRVARGVSKFPEVLAVQLLSGSYDLALEVKGDTLQDVAYFVASKLSTIKGVKATRTHFLLKKYKQAGFILHEDEDYERLKIVP
jgi:DNA-binding Lrp family transcriptional regulator